jgi:hypothetical protein
MKTLNKENKNKVGYIIIGICTIVIGALTISAAALKEGVCDPDTLCLGNVSAHTIVVLDQTDVLNINHQRFILNYINKEKDKLGKHEKFSIFSLTENTYINPEPIFSKCNPGNGKDANQLYQNPKKIKKKFEGLFSKPLKDNLSNAMDGMTSSRSPLFEIIRELSYRDDFSEVVNKRTLIIISDMMHHTKEYSQYKNDQNYQKFSDSSYAEEVAVDLNSVEVRIVYLLREKLENLQGSQHLSFWEGYFKNTGADVTGIRKVR